MTTPQPKPAGQRIAGIRGMNDIMPPDSALWERFEQTVRDWAASYGYRNIRTPIVEPTALFTRGIGAVTDIVEKEMYSFVDALNGESLSLRPENTAGVVRAAIEHNLLYDGPRRLWYVGPMFRHERPQRGRYRQFHQVGAEALGFAGPDIDAELIVMCQRLWDDLGLPKLELELNSIGDGPARAAHRRALVAHFERHADALDADARRRLSTNPLRILDSKNPAMQPINDAAPKLIDYLDDAARGHFEGVQTLLRDAGIHYRINPRLVRGLDYYNRTVFEWVTDALGAQGTVCGGGRYDPLIEQCGGKPAPGCGFAMGVERLLELMKLRPDAPPTEPGCDVYFVHQSEAAARAAFSEAEKLRQAGLDVILHCGPGSLKSQMKRADASGATLALILGDDELAQGCVTIKQLRGQAGERGAGEQRRVALAELVGAVSAALLE